MAPDRREKAQRIFDRLKKEFQDEMRDMPTFSREQVLKGYEKISPTFVHEGRRVTEHNHPGPDEEKQEQSELGVQMTFSVPIEPLTRDLKDLSSVIARSLQASVNQRGRPIPEELLSPANVAKALEPEIEESNDGQRTIPDLLTTFPIQSDMSKSLYSFYKESPAIEKHPPSGSFKYSLCTRLCRIKTQLRTYSKGLRGIARDKKSKIAPGEILFYLAIIVFIFILFLFIVPSLPK